MRVRIPSWLMPIAIAAALVAVIFAQAPAPPFIPGPTQAFPGAANKGSLVIIDFNNSASPAINNVGGTQPNAACTSAANAGSYWPVSGYMRGASLAISTANGKSAMRGNIDQDCAGIVNGASGPSPGGVIVPPAAAAGGFVDLYAADFYHIGAGSQSAFGWSLGNGTATAASVVAGTLEFVDDAGLSATILATNLMNATASSTVYAIPGSGAVGTEASTKMPFPVAGTLSKLVACTNGTQPTNNETMAVNVNGSASAITVTMLSTDTGRNCYADTTHTASVNAGDTFDFALTSGASTVNGMSFVGVVFTPASSNTTLVTGIAVNTAPSTTLNYYPPGIGLGGTITAVANAGVAFPFACTASKLYATLSTAGGQPVIATVMRNGVASALSGTMATTVGAQAVDTTHTVSFAKGDLVALAVSTASGTGAIVAGWSFACN